MIGPVVFEVYCYAPPELGVFPCKREGMTEFCLRGGRCPYASAVPTSVGFVANREIGLADFVYQKIKYQFDQLYYVIKWKIIKGSALKDLEVIDEQLDKAPEFLTWATVEDVPSFQFYQWLERVKADEAKLSEGSIEGTSDDVETTVASEEE